MKKILLIFTLFSLFSSTAQVTQIWTDYNSFWTSSSTNINPAKPNTAHNLLAFRWNGSNFSTAVNNAKLTANGVTFTPTKFRALPINSVPLTSANNAYFVGLGALVDGLPAAVDNGAINPFKPLTDGAQKAVYLTKGIQGLDLGSCLTNIPTGTAPNLTTVRFNLSSAGITFSNINDGVPDILISQIAQPSANNSDRFKFVNSSGATVGNEVVVLLSDNLLYPAVANWTADFYNNDSTQLQSTFVNTDRPMRFFAVDLISFGINASNYSQAVALIYTPGGDSDPAFLAFNEPSLGISTKLTITQQPTTSACNGSMASSFNVQLEDRLGLPVLQPGIEVTASMETGPGLLLGTLTAVTNASGVATFSNLSFEVGGDHKIRFSNSSLDAAISATITGTIGCGSNIWTGNGTNNNWNNTANWQIASIPNANNDVEIPAGRPRYPVLQNNAGAKNIILGDNATINLNGKVFAIAGSITNQPTAKIIANTDNSLLYMSGSTSQTIPLGLLLNGDLANLTIENAAGVQNADVLKIMQVLLVREGTLNTGNTLNLICRFTPTRRTAIVGPIGQAGFISGDVTVEQCFPARRAFRFLTSSVTTTTSIRANWQENALIWDADPNPGYGTHITGVGASGSNPLLTDGTNGFDWQPSGASSLFTFSNSLQTWNAVNNTQGNLIAGSAYRLLLRGNRSTNIQLNTALPSNTILRSKGSLLKGPVSVSNLSSTADHFNLVGNPFQSVVDMGLVNGVATNLKPFYYVWDPTLGGTPTVGQSGGRGAYVAINTLTGAKSNSLSEASILLQPYQAFFVQTSNLGTTPQMIFQEDYKVTTSTQTNVFKLINNENEEGSQFIELTLFNQEAFVSEDTPSDGLRIDFSNSSTDEIDDFDAVKFPNSDENIARKIGTTLISMENRTLPEAGDLLPLNVTQYRKSNYVMSIHLSDFENLDVYLKDFFTNQQVLLENGSISNYNFTVNSENTASTSADRFAFLFEESQLNTNQPLVDYSFSLFPNPTNGTSIFLNANMTFENAEIEIYNLLGQKVKGFKANFSSNNQIEIPVSELNTGIYMINAKTNTGLKFTSKFIKN